MNDFTRITWSSETARLAWQARIQHAALAWRSLELRSVQDGIREHALVFSDTPVGREVAPGRYAVGRDSDVLAAAYAIGDDDAVGELLGYPECCRDFFARTWGAGALDTTYQMYERSPNGADGPLVCNILGRWLGARYISHLPCSFTCDDTRAMGKTLRELLRLVDRDAADTIDDVLSWPVEWSALHGIAEVKYPVCKLSTRTTYTPSKLVVRREGVRYPPEGARGTHFPYRLHSERGSTVKPLPQPSQTVSSAPLTFHKTKPQDNGFSSLSAQQAGHAMILAALRESPPAGLTVDLGAGDGTLMDEVEQAFNCAVRGIERDARRANGHRGIYVTDLRDLTLDVDTFIVSQRRFEEISTLEAYCAAHARQTLVYSYDAPLSTRWLHAVPAY